MRYLLSLVRADVLQFLGVHAVEVWRRRAVRGTFRYGVASAYERARGMVLTRAPNDRTRVYDLAQAYIPNPVEDADDPTFDEVRHVPNMDELGEALQDLQVFHAEAPEDSGTSSTSTPWTSSSEDGRGTIERELEGPQEVPPQQAVGHSYRATDGALIVSQGSVEFTVPLPGWSYEEVWSIAVSIQGGDWTPVHDMMDMVRPREGVNRSPVHPSNTGLAPGFVALGSLAIRI